MKYIVTQWIVGLGFIVICILCFHTSVYAGTGINSVINFQGKLVNKADGTNVNTGTTNYNMTFKIYDAATNGNLLWTETWNGANQVAVSNGLFQVSLGSITPFGSSVNFNQSNLYLDITFNGEAMTTRIPFTAVPYAFNAVNLDGIIATQSAGGFNLQGGTSTLSTVSFTTSGTTLTLQPGNAGALTLQSNGANGLTMDTGGAGAVSIGGTNATSLGFGNSTTNPTYSFSGSGTFSTSTGQNTLSGNVLVAANKTMTFDVGTGTTNVTIKAGTGGTTAGLLVKVDTTANQVITTATTDTNNAVGVATSTTANGSNATIAISGVVSAVADNTVAVGDYIGIGTTTAGRAKSLGSTYPATASIQVIGRALSAAASAGSSFNLLLSGTNNSVSNICTTCLQQVPGTTGANTVSPTAAGVVAVTVNGTSNATTTADAVDINTIPATGLTATNGLLVQQNGAGTTTNAINITQTTGAVTNGLRFTGTFTSLIDAPNFSVNNAGGIVVGQNAGLAATGVDIEKNSLGNAAAVVNNTGGQGDIFTASSAGTTKFRLNSAGEALFQGDIIAASGSGAVGYGSNAFENTLGDTGSLIPNPGFETNISGSSFADGWVVAATNSAAVTRDTIVQAKGNASAKVTLSNSSTAFYSDCVPIATGVGKYILNYYAIGSSAKPTVLASLDTYSSEANCQSNTSPTFSHTVGGNVTTSWVSYGTGTNTAVTFNSTTNTWGRVHFFVSCASGCTNVTSNIDGVRLTEDPGATGNGGLDYAEMYPADPQNLAQPGDVVSFEPLNGSAAVIPANSTKDHDQDAIGVVSSNPGSVLDSGAILDPKVPVALAGRVPVKVSTEHGPIHIGDYLTGSDIPGVAVRAIMAGPVIGTAMQDDTDPNPANIGTITLFVKNMYYHGLVVPPFTTALEGQTILPPGLLKDNVLSVTTATVSGDLRVKGNNLIEGVLNVVDTLTTRNVLVSSLAEFFGNAVFHKDVTIHGNIHFKGKQYVDTSATGVATIRKGEDSVQVVFENAYDSIPVVNINLLIDSLANEQKQAILNNGYSFAVVNSTGKGFSIALNKKALEDLSFSWIAFGVDNTVISPVPTDTTQVSTTSAH